MFDPSSFVNPTPLARADTPRDVLPRGGTSHTYEPLCCLEHFAVELEAPLVGMPDTFRRPYTFGRRYDPIK
ncbi:hypothetical protein TNCV_4097361 [Trichonephila clavipes]|nr:hypothetical protein TNCV_4097361 [Trichonephila clavipes]